MRNRKRLMKLNNKGVSLVTVILTIAFVTILVSVVLMTSAINYKMKRVNAYAKDSFYSAEQVLDEINIGLQRFISDSLSVAYTDVMVKYSEYSVAQKEAMVQTAYYENMWKKLEEPSSGHSQYDTEVLYDMLKPSTVWRTDGNNDSFGAVVRALDKDGNLSDKGIMITYENGIVLKDLQVFYKDSKGVVSSIRTDIRLTYPDFDFAATTALPNISSYAVIADEGMKIQGTTGSTLTLEGNVYADSMVSEGTFSVTKPINHVGDGSVVVKHAIELKDAALSNEETGVLWANDIETIGGDLDLKGETLIADDLNVNGNGSKIVLSGIYNGYGNSIDDSGESSAILVNGSNSSIDLTGLQSITLAGHAYVGTKSPHLFSILGEADEVKTQKDIYTGESVAIKSNQLMYLVPAGCIGVNKLTGTSLYGKNPMSRKEYEDLQKLLEQPNSSYVEVSLTTPVAKLGNESLAAYMSTTPEGVAQPEKVFVPINNNSDSMVYYYMKFKSEKQANAYFKRYYNTNKDLYDRYVKSYVDLLEFPVKNNATLISTAGHSLEGRETTKYEFVENTLDDAAANLSLNHSRYQERFNALCTYLKEDLTQSPAMPGLDNPIVFDNIVDAAKLQAYMTEFNGGTITYEVTLPKDAAAGTPLVILSTNPAGYVVTDSDVSLVIATGPVTVNVSDYKGTVISDKEVMVTNGVSSISVDQALVNSVLRYANPSTKEMVVNVLRDAEGYRYYLQDTGDEEKEISTMADLIVYENWKKE